MRIDSHIFDNIPVPTVGLLRGGETFIYNDNIYMKLADTSYHGYTAVNLADGELIYGDDLPDETGVTVVEINATRIN